ncbi:radical SAM protein [candidate division KSB1 bacterium]|nr:radical SAM protein [candidate division KSB1 bacterium]NIR72781.1 radical SAM protein [candidate division KSB1 bacterium]NIT70657.1 radical SAM protein [candidate division KSB1 bacterium]NIU24385.1 radical SAM protein [candidate division KSB1 bacterium]NIU94078.1 radical SAM protein [candidate division KSB1 bacterium]
MDVIELQKSIIYGPVNSRRLGRSLGVNLLPTTFKMCSLNCSYCQYGWTSKMTRYGEDYREFFPSVQQVLLALKDALNGHPNDFDYITFSGNGEPTLHPDFSKIVDLVIETKAYLRSNAKTAILSNSTTCGEPRIKEALDKIDLPIMKLDVGNERAFRKVNHGIPPITLESIMEGLKSLNQYTVQSMFIQGVVDNSTDFEVNSWIEKLLELKPMGVQIYSLDRGAASNRLNRVQMERLEQIAELAEKRTGLKVDVF